jgi:glucose dehydrogenase
MYMVHGKQYLVIGAGGGKNTPGREGGTYVAFTLKEKIDGWSGLQ